MKHIITKSLISISTVLLLSACSNDSSNSSEKSNKVEKNKVNLIKDTLVIEDGAKAGSTLGKIELEKDSNTAREYVYVVSFELDDNENFTIDSHGVIRLKKTFKFTGVTKYHLNVTVTYSNGYKRQIPLVVKVPYPKLDIPNDTASVTIPKIEGFTASIKEDVAIGTIVGKIKVLNNGGKNISSFRINDTVNFSVDNQGNIRTKTTFDFDYKKTYNIRAIAENSAGYSRIVNIVVNILDVNSSVDNNTDNEISHLPTSANYFKYAWSINENLDQRFKNRFGIVNDAHMNLANAWTHTKGEKVKVAVIDSSFDASHPEIAGKIISKYNVMNGTSTLPKQNHKGQSHGTAVAGSIAATNLGVAPNVELILIHLDLGKPISEYYYLNAFEYAKRQGAQVINCSWGGGGTSEALKDKLQEMKDSNITVLFASGNGDKYGNAIDLDRPYQEDQSELDSVIGVGATSPKNDVTSYSNYGSKIDVLAPGGGGTDNGYGLIGVVGLDVAGPVGNGSTNPRSLLNQDYVFISGTSFAAPKATGAVALMLSMNPKLKPEEVRSILVNTATKVGGRYANYNYNGFDRKRAYGKINTSAAVQSAIKLR